MSKISRLGALAVFALFCQSNGLADLIYNDIPDTSVYSGSANIDIDGDSATDFIFETTQNTDGFRIFPQGNNRVIINGASQLAALPNGFGIGPALVLPHDWSSSAMVPINACVTFPEGISCIGEFKDVVAFMGFEMEIAGLPHYGWIRINTDELSIASGGTLLDYAYESTPDQSIAAGAIPEPSTFLLTLLGLFVFGLRRRNESRL